MAASSSTTPPASTPPTGSAKSKWAGRALDAGVRIGGLAFAIIIVIAIFTLIAKPNTFLTLSNSLVIMRGMSTIAIVALGLLIVIVVGEIDLSFGFALDRTFRGPAQPPDLCFCREPRGCGHEHHERRDHD